MVGAARTNFSRSRKRMTLVLSASRIATASTGLAFNIGNGFDIVGYQGSGTPRPDYVAGCNPTSGSFNWAGVQSTAGTPER